MQKRAGDQAPVFAVVNQGRPETSQAHQHSTIDPPHETRILTELSALCARDELESKEGQIEQEDKGGDWKLFVKATTSGHGSLGLFGSGVSAG